MYCGACVNACPADGTIKMKRTKINWKGDETSLSKKIADKLMAAEDPEDQGGVKMALESQVLNLNKGLVNFTHEIEKNGGENISVCYQCGTCTGSCPMGRRNALRHEKDHENGVSRAEGRPAQERRDLVLLDLLHVYRQVPEACKADGRHHGAEEHGYEATHRAEELPATAGFIYQTGHGVPNNDANRALRVKLGLPKDPPTTHTYPEYIPGIQKILDATGLMAIKAAVEGGKK